MIIPFLSLKDVTALHGAEINEAVTRVVNNGWYLQGEENKRFEENYANFIGSKYCVGCANGLDALIWIFRAYIEMGVMRPGDEVIVPAYTYTSTAAAAVHCGAKVVFIDIQKDGNPKTHMPEMDYEALENAITTQTKAVIAVDLGGIVCDYERIFEIVERKKNLFKAKESDGTPLGNLATKIQKSIGRVIVLADCAHSLGASRFVNGETKYCGSIADFTSFSFHAVKNFTTAEGGASTWVPIHGIDNAEIIKGRKLLLAISG